MKEVFIYILLLILFTFLWDIIDWIRLWLFWYDDIWTKHILWLILLYHMYMKK